MKDELNFFYDGGGVAYLLKSVAIHFNLTVRSFSIYCRVEMGGTFYA